MDSVANFMISVLPSWVSLGVGIKQEITGISLNASIRELGSNLLRVENRLESLQANMFAALDDKFERLESGIWMQQRPQFIGGQNLHSLHTNPRIIGYLKEETGFDVVTGNTFEVSSALLDEILNGNTEVFSSVYDLESFVRSGRPNLLGHVAIVFPRGSQILVGVLPSDRVPELEVVYRPALHEQQMDQLYEQRFGVSAYRSILSWKTGADGEQYVDITDQRTSLFHPFEILRTLG